MICQAGQLLGFRSVSYLLGFLRSFMLTVSIVLFVGVILAVSEKFPRIAWIAVLLAVAVTVRDFRRGRGSSSHEGGESHDVEGSDAPAWMDNARWYYSEIGGEESADPVCVFDASDREELNSESPGTLFLQLEPRYLSSPRVRVLDADGREQGIIRSEGIVPCVRFAMRRNGELVWMLSVRSIVAQAPRSGTGEWRFVDVRHAVLLVAKLEWHHFRRLGAIRRQRTDETVLARLDRAR